MLRSSDSRTRTWRATRPTARRTMSTGSTSPIPTRRSRTRRPAGPDLERRRHHLRRRPGPGAGRGLLLAPRGRDLHDREWSTSPPRRAAARRSRRPQPTRATATATARSGHTTRTSNAHAASSSRPARPFSTSPTTSPQPAWHARHLRGRRRDNYVRGLDPRRRDLRHRAEPARSSRDRRAPVRRRVRRRHVQPGRAHALREHPGRPGMTFAIWGPWGRIGV